MELGDRNKKFADAVNEFMKQLLVNGLIPGRNEEFTEAIQIAIHNPQYVRMLSAAIANIRNDETSNEVFGNFLTVTLDLGALLQRISSGSPEPSSVPYSSN